MLIKKMKFLGDRLALKSLKLVTMMLCAASLLHVTGTVVSNQAIASDMDLSQTTSGEEAKFVRIGLNKSIVIHLPADAQDVIVGNPLYVDAVVRTKNTAYLFARNVGQTNIFFFDANGQQILNLDLEVTADVTALQRLLQRAIPGTKITVDTINKHVVLGGVAANITEAKQAIDLATSFGSSGSTGGGFFALLFGPANGSSGNVINTIRIAGEDQVMLKVRIVEVQRNILKQFGVNLQALLQAGKFAIDLTSLNPIAAANGAKAVYTDGTNSITGAIRAMESDGVLKTLAEPNLTAISGKSANFQAGGEVPIKTCTGGLTPGSQVCSVEYKEFGVSLGFTPFVLTEGRIQLDIQTDVSDLGPKDSDGNPSFNTRSAKTTIELPSGGSMMLAGLIKDATRQSIDGTPGLRKLPILGALFRSRDYAQNQTELVVIVTPYLVGSVAEKQLATPADNFNVPTDRQTILLGRLNKVYGTPGKNPDGVYHGNVGFIIE
jgi:pilus assembly protein CpaC